MSPLSCDQFVHKVKAALQVANVNSESYSGHSFRIGVATTAAAAGVPADTIKMLGCGAQTPINSTSEVAGSSGSLLSVTNTVLMLIMIIYKYYKIDESVTCMDTPGPL